MKLRILIEYIEIQIRNCQDYLDEKNEEESDYYTIEANHTCKELRKVVDQLKAYPNDIDATVDNTRHLKNFFECRWERIKSTDAAYFIDVNPHVTNLCVNIARMLSDIYKINLFALLMPTVYSWHSSQMHREMGYYDLRNMLLTENNKYMIDIFSLKTVVTDGRVTFKARFTDSCESVILTPEESEMVINHCVESRLYYQALVSGITDTKKLNHLRVNLIASRQNTMGKLEVTASYGKDGIDRLKKRLINASIVTLRDVRPLTSYCIQALIKNQNIFSQQVSIAQFHVLKRYLDKEKCQKIKIVR